ncbi:MAG: DUF1269 domain-containing protein [Clostridia bacterium]|nr:DUF1269 domain-containing protein [Clostridia bacterium]
MRESIIIAKYEVESEAYQAFSELKRAYAGEGYIISQAAVVKRENGSLTMRDFFDSGAETGDDAVKGGIIGGLIGILGGPFGILIGGGMGILLGSAIDAGDALDNASLLERASDCIAEGETALILLAQEELPAALDVKLCKFDVSVIRLDAAEVAVEIEHANEVARQAEREARAKLREEKTEAFKAKVKKKNEEIKSRFEALREEFEEE